MIPSHTVVLETNRAFKRMLINVPVPPTMIITRAYEHSKMLRKYRKISNIRRTKSTNVDISRLVLQLSSPNPMKPGVKSRMKM